ncbi:hypothetical protein JL58_10345 [Listeria ivanovii subsp. londoniensis]|nr:hypothetical protein JL58_10345 [Listeria ivanovii subsp. londoniensis]
MYIAILENGIDMISACFHFSDSFIQASHWNSRESAYVKKYTKGLAKIFIHGKIKFVRKYSFIFGAGCNSRPVVKVHDLLF